MRELRFLSPERKMSTIEIPPEQKVQLTFALLAFRGMDAMGMVGRGE
jgi:hypothetical protein